MLHPESVAILGAALGCSDCMVDGTRQVAFHQLVAVRASVAPLPILGLTRFSSIKD